MNNIDSKTELLNMIENCLGKDNPEYQNIINMVNNRNARLAYVLIYELRNKGLIYGDNIDKLMEKFWWDCCN